MMKISNFAVAEQLVSQRKKLVSDWHLANTSLGVTIRGSYQDDAFVDCCRPYAQAELQRRIADVDAQLTALGVDMSAAAPLEA